MLFYYSDIIAGSEWLSEYPWKKEMFISFVLFLDLIFSHYAICSYC